MPRPIFQILLCSMLPTILPVAAKDAIIPVLEQHCLQCHGRDGKVKGKLDLLKFKDTASLAAHPEILENIVEAIDFEEMPPEDEPQMTSEVRTAFLTDLKTLLHKSVASRGTFPHTPLRRMNRFQYNNAVTDLFDLNCIVFTLPERMMRDHGGYFQPASGKMPDTVRVGSRPLGKSQMIEPRLAGVAAFPQDLRAEHGFDNRGDHLSLSPLLMESFLALGQSITQSPDFTAKRVGIWNSFFAPPAAGIDPDSEVRERLRPFLHHAFRRPVDEPILDRYTAFASRRLAAGSSFTDAMKSVSAAVISSPRFLYLYDQSGTPGTTAPLNDYDLASRLSFFLWGSIPDQSLLDLAATNQLSQPDVLVREVDRMLHDRKLKRFCDSFPSQWLQLDRIISSKPDPKHFPQFYFDPYRMSMHMMLEPLLLFETILIENRPLTELIDAPFTYRSLNLQKAYGKLSTLPKNSGLKGSGPTVLTFRRTPVEDKRSGGVITNAAVMTMTSGPERTQPITRGAWIATVIFNNPPKPPPADVPPLSEQPPAGEEHLTLRERLTMHRERADCRGCHEQIDPLGFALENYGPIGNWRTTYGNGRPIEVGDTLLRKHQFTTVLEFKEAILSEKDRFTRALAGHLLSFALARNLGAPDQPVLDQITTATAADNYRLQSLLKQVILSDSFLSNTAPPLPSP